MGKDGHVLVRRPVTVVVPVAEEREEEVNGVKKKVTVVTYRQEVRTVESKFDGKNVQVFGTDGKELDAKAVAKALEKETAALLSADGMKVDPFYLRFLKDGTLILVATMPAPMPVPVPPEKE
jgi:hypothetical protein